MVTPILTIQQARQDIRDTLASQFTQKSTEGSIPSAAQIQRTQGTIYPYIVYRFPDIIPSAETSMNGPQDDGYMQMVNFIIVGPDVETVESLYMKVLSVFIGHTPPWSGPMTKRGGSGTYPIGVDDAASEAWVSGINFAFTTTAMPVF